MSDSADAVPHKIQIEIDAQTAQGIYSNLIVMNISSEEAVLDFAYRHPNDFKAKANSRIILSPGNAKRLIGLLQANILEYEKQFGPITDEPQRPGITLSVN